jgi:hypothetical protein
MPDPTPLRDEPSAVWLHLLADHRTTRRAAVLLTRWTDPLGQSHWLVECLYNHSYGQLDQTGRTVGQWKETYLHPLHRVAPIDRFVERKVPRGLAQPLLVCACGAVGSPEALAWRGTQCGPCHDREQDGDPPLGPFVPALSQKVLLGDEHGWIVEEDGTVSALDLDGQVQWSRDGEGLDAFGGRRELLLWSRHREIYCVDGRTGQVLGEWITREPIREARVLDADTLVTVHPSHLEWWRVGFTEPHQVVRFTGSVLGRLATDPSGDTLLLLTDEGIVCLSRHGYRLATLSSWEHSLGGDVIALSPTEVLALRHAIYRSHLHFWDVFSESTSTELIPRVSRTMDSTPRLLRPFDSPPVPLLRFPDSLQRIDPETLTAPITLTFPGREAPELTPVGPDHVLLRGTRENLLVPWRDLLGLEATRNS